MAELMSSDIRNLVKLLSLEDQNSSDDDVETCPVSSLNPSSIKCNKSESPQPDIETKCRNRREYNGYYKKSDISKDIWPEDEVLDEISDELFGKESPDYELVYQQNVTPDDIYLQLSGKDPGSNACDSMILKILLEEISSAEDIDLNVSSSTLTCKTKKYFLDLELPRRVDPVKSSAKWNQSEHILIVELILNEDISSA